LPVNLPECNETSQKSFNVGVEGPACSGTPKLEFIPGTATKNHQVTASVSNLTNCDGKVTTFNCAQGLSISSCTYSGSTGCTRTFTAPSTEGSYNCTANVSGIALSKPVILPVVDCVRQKPVLTIEPVSQKGAKNDSLIYIVTVGNNNTCMSTFNLDVACLDNWGCELYDTTLPDLDIDEGDSASANLVIKSPATGVSVGSKYTHSLTAYDESANASINTINANYEVALCYRKNPTLKAVKASQSGSPEQERKYSVKITNLDNCSSYYALNLSCEDGWICDLDSPYLYLFDGERADFAVTLTPESGISAGSYNFNLTAVNYFDESKTASIALTYTVTGLRANQSTLDQMFGHYVVGDDNCDTILGENISNSPDDCAPPPVEAPPVCGNNIIEAGEDCDGTSDATCPNLCDADCICPFIIGDAICDASAGESSAISVDCQKKASSASLIMILIGILGAVGGVSYYFMRRRGMLGGLAAVHGVETATPGVNLGTAVNNMLSEGYNPDEIHSNLEAGGWSHSKIEAAMGSAQEDQEALGKLAEQQGVAAPVEKAKATRYVKKCLAQGYDPTQVRTALMSGGWPADAVDGVISKQTASHIQSHAEKAGVAEPSDDIHALKEYVRKEMNEGHTKQDITKILKKSGWSDSDIKDAFGR
jgi:SOS response regulatory protein OraA/RecX